MSQNDKSSLNSDLDTALNATHGAKMDESKVDDLLDSLFHTGFQADGVTSNTNTSGEGVYTADSSSDAVTFTLQDGDIVKGAVFVIADAGANANNNNITINTQSSQTIDGSSSQTISTANGTSVLLAVDSTTLVTIA